MRSQNDAYEDQSSMYGRGACFARAVGMMPEAIKGLSCVFLIGDENIHIENFLSIVQFSDTFLKLKVKGGFLVIEGCRFKISYFNEVNMELCGIFKRLSFEKY